MTRKYHTLLVRDNAAEPWGAHFGDYGRECVEGERENILDDAVEFGAAERLTPRTPEHVPNLG
jgi:hypothetical protein